MSGVQVAEAKQGNPHQRLLDRVQELRTQQQQIREDKKRKYEKIEANQLEASEIRRRVEVEVGVST